MDGIIAYILSKKYAKSQGDSAKAYADEVGRRVEEAGFKAQVEQDRSILEGAGQVKILYLLPKESSNPKDGYDEYIYTNGSWELIGSTDIDLSSYTTRLNTVEQELGNKLDDKNDVIKTNHIQNGAVTIDKLSDGFKQYVQNSLNGKVSTSDKIARIEVPASLATGLDGVTHARFPELDTTNKVLKIPKGMLLIMRNGQNINLAPSGIVSISYSDVTTTTTKVLYNISTNTFRAVSTDDTSSTNNDVLICTIRDGSNFELTDHGMSIACPYIIDGKFFGVNLVDYIPNGSITESKLSTAYKQSVQSSVDRLATSFQNVANGLSTNINAVKKMSLTNLIKGATFAFGSVANSTGAETAADNRICSGFINVADVQVLKCSITSGYKYAITCYDSQRAFAARTAGGLYWVPLNYQTAERTIPLHPAVKYIRVTISDNSNSTNITLDDSNKIKVLADYSQYRRFQFLNNYQGKLQESIIPHDVWSNGITDGSTFASDSTRIFSGLIELPKSGTIKISTTAGYKANYVVFDENMTRIKAVGYDTLNSIEIGNNYKWLVIAIKIDSANNVDISPNEGSNCTISYVPTDNVQFVENVATSAATNAVTNAENIQHIDDIVTNPTVDISWEYGILWQNAEGDGDPPFTRIRSSYIPVGKGTRVRCATGYQHIVFKFDLQKKWISNPNWTPNEIVVDQDCLIRITVAKSDNSVISESEISTIGNSEIIIREFPQFIADNVLDFSDRVPSYYNTQLKAAIDSALNNIVAAGKNGESFIFFSDPHWEGNAKWSPALIKEITKQTNINTIICGGDLIEGGNKAAMVKAMNNLITRFKGAGKLYVAYGNHDGNTIGSPSNDDHLTKGETYALAQKQSDFDVQYGNLCYYYFDNPTTKTRFIVLDTGINQDAALDSTQRTWFQTTLNNMPTGYHALIFAHIIYVSDNWRVGMSALEFNRTTFMDEICTICDTFNSANNGKKVEAMFGGHTHFDLDPTLDTNSEPNHVNRFTSTGRIPIIIIDCNTVTTASADGQGNRNAVRGTITEQCFDIVTVDYGAKKVECVRIGRGSDRTISYTVSSINVGNIVGAPGHNGQHGDGYTAAQIDVNGDLIVTEVIYNGDNYTTQQINLGHVVGADGHDYVLTDADKTAIATKTAEMINISDKADKATTLVGYGITDAYTKTEVNAAIQTAIGGVENGSY